VKTRLLLAISAVVVIFFQTAMGTSLPSRSILNVDFDWRFIQQDMSGAEQPACSDSSWRRFDVPYDWSVEDPYSPTNHLRNSWLPGSIGWHRKTFVALGSWLKGTVFVRFDGIYMNSTVWLNGKKIGGRPYGFSSFDCDLAGALHAGTNVLAVRVCSANRMDEFGNQVRIQL